MSYLSTKTYGHEEGISCAFRQWRANHSHCQLLHGYALSFRFVFEADQLDERGWVVDFGGLKGLKEKLKATFDHRVVIAGDDPQLEIFKQMNTAGVAKVIIFPDGVGVERFARVGFAMASDILLELGLSPRVRVASCECSEHGANSAVYIREEA